MAEPVRLKMPKSVLLNIYDRLSEETRVDLSKLIVCSIELVKEAEKCDLLKAFDWVALMDYYVRKTVRGIRSDFRKRRITERESREAIDKVESIIGESLDMAVNVFKDKCKYKLLV